MMEAIIIYIFVIDIFLSTKNTSFIKYKEISDRSRFSWVSFIFTLLNKLKQIPNAKRLLDPLSVKYGNKYVPTGKVVSRNIIIINSHDVRRIIIPLVLLKNLGSKKSVIATPI